MPTEKPRFFTIGVFECHECGTAPLAADGQSLDEAESDQEQRSGHADRGLSGEQTDTGAGHPHQDHGQDEHLLTAKPVTEMPEDRTTERAGNITDG